MRRHVVSTIIAVGLFSLLVGTAAAQQTSTTETKTFEVISVEGNHLVVRLPEGTREITVPEDFRFTVSGKQVSVHELKPGMTGTATITTRTTLKPVTVTEVKNGRVEKVVGSTIIVRTDKDVRMFTQSDVDKRGVKIIRNGKPVSVSQLKDGDNLTATIITEKPPQRLTEREVQATITGAPQQPAASSVTFSESRPASPAPVDSRPRATATPAPAAPSPQAAPPPAPTRLPRTASPLPLVGLMGVSSLALGVGLTIQRRRRLRR
jgi:hypothetical protein